MTDTSHPVVGTPTPPPELFALLPEIFLLVGPDGCIEYVSAAWEAVSGFTAEETIGRRAIDCVDPRDQAALATVFERLWEQGNVPLSYQSRCITRHGRDAWLAGHVMVTSRSDGQRVLVGVLRDVTRAVGSAALGIGDLRFILDALPGMSFVTNQDGQIVHLSRACEQLFGKGLTNGETGHWHLVVHPDDRERAAAEAQDWQRQRVPFSSAVRLRDVAGAWRHVHVVGVPRFADDGTFRGHLGFVADETAVRDAADQAAQHNQMFASLLDALIVAAFVTDPDGNILIANQAGRRMLERTRGRGVLPSARAGDLTILREDGSLMPEAEWPWLLVRQTGEPQSQRVLGVRYPEGDEQWFVVSYQLVPLTQSIWPARSVMSSWEDITPIREAAKELRVANEALARSARMKDEFMASMSHELRTPLNAVLGLSEAMLDEVFGAVTERQVEALRDVAMSGRHLLDLINDILDLAKIGAGKMEPDYDWTDLRETCEAAMRMVQQASLAKHQRLQLTVSDGAVVRFTDPRWLRQIIANLLSNAVKFTPDGGAIHVSLELGARDATFVVTDTGVGIGSDEQTRIFEPFVQLKQGLNRPQGGTGLGLALVSALAEQLGGRVSLESRVGEGSTFRVWLPLEPEAKTDPLEPREPMRAEPGSLDLPGALSNRRVLLAEDNEANVRTFVAYLQSKGYRVDVARNGQIALDMLASHTYDVVLMDVQMPVLDGIAATQRIRANPALVHLPIIALTAFAMPGDRERCLEAGANEHIAKPVRLKRLVQTIEALCDARAS